jgi:4-amino-4-deoxy-L-arabinose transferase-like glycosyltransferase
MISYVKRFPYLSWIFLGGLVFIPNLGASHLFDWDEINFAESAREMLVSQDFLSVCPFGKSLLYSFGCKH